VPRRSVGRFRRRRNGQVIILTAIIITIVVLSLVSLVSQTVNLHQNLRYEPYKEVTEDLAASFRSALAFVLANMTVYLNGSSDPSALRKGREAAYRYISTWKNAAMLAYADLGLQIDFTTPLNESSAYVLQGAKTIAFPIGDGEYYYDYINPWKLYNLTQVHWDQSMGCSTAYATLHVNLTEYGFYGWKKDIIVAANATIQPDSFTGSGFRSPADIVIILDGSGSMTMHDPSNYDSDDPMIHLRRTISPSTQWVTVGILSVGEIPTRFRLYCTSSSSKYELRLKNGSFTPQLEVNYTKGSSFSTIYLSPTDDAYVRSSNPNNKYGSAKELWVQNFDGNLVRSWVKFDLSPIPSGSTINGAELTLYLSGSYMAAGQEYNLHHSNNDASWSEGGITWNNQPSFDSSHVDSEAPETGWMSWDVTPDVANDYASDKKSSWVIKDEDEGAWPQRYIMMNSKDYTGGGGSKTLISFSGGGSKRIVLSNNLTDDNTIDDDESSPSSYTYIEPEFGRENMWFYGKAGDWMIQVKNKDTKSLTFTIDAWGRKVDRCRNAATAFLKLLNPSLDRVAIVQYGPGCSDQSGPQSPTGYWYNAPIVSMGSYYGLNSPFYNLSDPAQFEAALYDLNWANPRSLYWDDVGYGFKRWGPSVNDYYTGSGTPLGAGLEVGARIFNGTQAGWYYSRPDAQRIMIMLSDGWENKKPSPLSPPGPNVPAVDYDPPPFYSVVSDLTGDAYLESNVTTYTIGYGGGIADDECMIPLAENGHGEYFYAPNGTELTEILSQLAYMLNDKLSLHFEFMQEYGTAINYLPASSLTVYFVDPVTHMRHKVLPTDFGYQGGGDFVLDLSLGGYQSPEAVDIVIKDPRGIIVRLHLPLTAWGS